MKRRIIAALLALVATAAGVFAVASPASAAAWCGSACDGKDPNTYIFNGATCASDAFTPDSIWHGVEFLELRYSPRCRTIWIRSNAYQSPDNVIGGYLGIYHYDEIGIPLHGAYLPHFNGTRWSVMFNDAGLCGMGQLYAAGSAYDFTICY